MSKEERKNFEKILKNREAGFVREIWSMAQIGEADDEEKNLPV
jgi:hypothetical protein